MDNQLNKLLENILIEHRCKPNLRKALVKHLTEETREYYELLKKRMNQGEKLAPIELKIMSEKINDDMEGLKRTLLAQFVNGETALPVAIAYIFDDEGMQQKVNKIKANPHVEYVCGFVRT